MAPYHGFLFDCVQLTALLVLYNGFIETAGGVHLTGIETESFWVRIKALLV
jgi:hypothetical protein